METNSRLWPIFTRISAESHVEPPKTSGFNHNLRSKLGSYGSYNGIKKSYFDSLVQDIASGDILELDAKEELYKLDLWNENNIPSYLPKNTQMGVAVVNVQKLGVFAHPLEKGE